MKQVNTENKAASGKLRLNGIVVSDKQQRTVVVQVVRTTRHPLYKKTMRHLKKYKADNILGAKLGEQVVIEETRPISKDKRFYVKQILQGAKLAQPVMEDKSDLELLLEHDESPKAEVKEEG